MDNFFLHTRQPRSREFLDIDLPRFHRATSIELRGHCLRLTLPPRPAGFPALQRLSLSGCRVDLADLTPLCPRLRVLAVNITVKSGSLEELAAANLSRWTGRIDVDAPMLKKLALSFSIDGELGVSIVAPIVDKVSWECSYSRLTVGLDPWSLSSGLTSYPDAELTFEQEIGKHLVTSGFSALEPLFTTMECDCDIRSVGHVFGSFALRLLGMHRIRTATQKLKIIFQRPDVKAECPVNCPCDEPKSWRSKDISLINLEQVEIEGLEGEDHEFDFLKVVFRCAPMLKRMAVRMSDAVRISNGQCSKIYDIFRAYPYVECNVDPTYGKKILHE
ncbi:hypothetical protein TRIUR3_11501 [Triticum urartu]|uniref:FBD domain-containing protein n=3 Tax=Triticum urartu TaxID=4572 RepID=M7YP77_TRIUA|nr:hypothetical protein TRIUR3_11501 [Triticum urartu]